MVSAMIAAPGLIDISKRIEADFREIDGVQCVSIIDVRGLHQVEIHLSDFTRLTRRKVYAAEREIYRAFPDDSFDFIVVDSSERVGDAAYRH